MPESGECWLFHRFVVFFWSSLNLVLVDWLQVAKSIKRSRNFGILPHIGEYVVQDASPFISSEDSFHQFKEAVAPLESKTVL